MAKWSLNLLKWAAYSTETANLNHYMKQGFDPYDFHHLLGDWMSENHMHTPETEALAEDDSIDLMGQWDSKATPKEKEAFKQWVLNHRSVGQYPTEDPPYIHMSYEGMKKAQWLVHFTDDPESIADGGFKYGFDNDYRFNGLAVTTHFRDSTRKKRPGYNFAFSANDTRGIVGAANSKKYGHGAVVFWSSAVESYHYGDKERQMIFYGPQVNPHMIFPILWEGNESKWKVGMKHSQRSPASESFSDCVQWIIAHHDLITQDRNAAQRLSDHRKREYKKRYSA